MDVEKINKLKLQIATQLLTWTRLNQHDLKIKFIPPTEEQAITEYQNSPMFHHVVDTMVHGIIDIIERG